VHPPSIDHGLASGIWGVVLGLYVLFGLIAIGVDNATAIVLGGLSAAAIFLFVRLFGGDRP
jgi:hypothetical protein